MPCIGSRLSGHAAFAVRVACSLVVPVSLLCAQSVSLADESDVVLDVTKYDRSSQIEITQHESLIEVSWPIGRDRQGRLTFDLRQDRPLIHSVAVSSDSAEPVRTIAAGLDPVLMLRVGERDLSKRGGWTIFFDRMQEKPHDTFEAKTAATRAAASSNEKRATLTIGDVSAGPFGGHLQWTFYAGAPFVLQEAVLETETDGRAFLYDVGLVCRKTLPSQMTWHDGLGVLRIEDPESISDAKDVAVRGRTIAARFPGGSLAVFPPPHRYFYPLDFSDNLNNIWVGEGYRAAARPFGFGIRHDPRGDNRFVPWFNAPPGTGQEMGLFLLLSDGSADETLKEVARLTRNDRFAPLDGHTVFTSHFHVEHTRELLNAPMAASGEGTSAAAAGRLPSGGAYTIPERLENPGFVRTFREMGIDVVHLAEFHFGETPRMTVQQRLAHLELLHAECERLSDEEFLLLPGEEPNVHFGGHWISFFPKPVYWVLNRPPGTPFVTEHPQLGRVYHVGGEADVFQLLRAEQGLAWTAHPRIKGSTGYPDRYRDRLFFQSDRFLGAAWKAMPADLSEPRLGSRVLNLLDDMSNWGDPKYVLGEVDVFKIEPDHELYGHMNVNYLRLDTIPRFEEGWQPILDALRGGRFFVTTGEVLIPNFTVEGRASGERAAVSDGKTTQIALDLEWTFPLSYAEVVSGDGETTRRTRVDLSKTGSFGRDTFTIDADLAGERWVRVEVWDVATNGAFTQPVWLEPAR